MKRTGALSCRARVLLAGCLLAGARAAEAGACSGWQLEAGLGQVSSGWEEFDGRGQRLLREHGRLATGAAVATANCPGLEWELGVQDARGTRDYVGVTNTGVPLRTISRITQSEVHLQGLVPLAQDWWIGARVARQRIDRELVSAGAAQGYPEQYRYWRAALGTRHVLLDGVGWQLLGDAWLGVGPPGHMVLRLPGRDAATLVLGRSQSISLGLDWCSRDPRADTVAGWSWQVRTVYALERTGAGAAQLVTRHGVVVGAALQPRTRQSGAGLSATLRYAF